MIGHVITVAFFLAWYWFGRYMGVRSERRVTRHLFQESAVEHDRLCRQLEAVRRQLAAAVVRSVDGP